LEAQNLTVTAWVAASATPHSTATITVSSSVATVSSTDNVTLTASVRGAEGGTPSGSVTWFFGAFKLGTAPLSGAGGTATAALTVNAAPLNLGADTLTAQYSGDLAYDSATASLSLTVTTTSGGTPTITGVANGASFRTSYAPGMLFSVFGTNLAPATVV